jgi:hypothetical protein
MIVLSRIIVFILLLIPGRWNEISSKNAAIKAAAESYGKANYEASIENHLKLSSEFGIKSPNLDYNLALSYHYNDQPEDAQRTYLTLLNSSDKVIASFASNQNGILLGNQKKYKEALEAFKIALIKDPLNESARFNYELLSRWLEENPEEQQKQEDQQQEQENQEEQKDQENQDQQKQEEKKDGEGDEQTEEDEASESQKKEDKSGEKSQQEEPSEEPSDMESDLSEREKAMEQMRERLEQMNLNPEQAAQILDAMNAAELRYIQQNKKKPTKRPDRGLPDW